MQRLPALRSSLNTVSWTALKSFCYNLFIYNYLFIICLRRFYAAESTTVDSVRLASSVTTDDTAQFASDTFLSFLTSFLIFYSPFIIDGQIKYENNNEREPCGLLY